MLTRHVAKSIQILCIGHGVKVRPEPQDLEPRDPPQSLKVGPHDPLQKLKIGPQDPLQSLKVGSS